MDSTLFSLTGGVFAGIISIIIYESAMACREKLILLKRPLEYNYLSPADMSLPNMTTNFSLRFYLRNRTHVSLPVRISIGNRARASKFGERQIQWMGRTDYLGLQDIMLSPGEWGEFVLNGSVANAQEDTISIDLEVVIPTSRKRRKPIPIKLGTTRIKF